MYLRLMIYHGKGSTKTISMPDTLMSDFKKFPSNLFDLWKCVQVHREWFQIYHILVRIINDFQFVNLMLPQSQQRCGIFKGWYGGPRCWRWSVITLSTQPSYLRLTFHLFPTLTALPTALCSRAPPLDSFFKRRACDPCSSHCSANLGKLKGRY